MAQYLIVFINSPVTGPIVLATSNRHMVHNWNNSHSTSGRSMDYSNFTKW